MDEVGGDEFLFVGTGLRKQLRPRQETAVLVQQLLRCSLGINVLVAASNTSYIILLIIMQNAFKFLLQADLQIWNDFQALVYWRMVCRLAETEIDHSHHLKFQRNSVNQFQSCIKAALFVGGALAVHRTPCRKKATRVGGFLYVPNTYFDNFIWGSQTLKYITNTVTSFFKNSSLAVCYS